MYNIFIYTLVVPFWRSDDYQIGLNCMMAYFCLALSELPWTKAFKNHSSLFCLPGYINHLHGTIEKLFQCPGSCVEQLRDTFHQTRINTCTTGSLWCTKLHLWMFVYAKITYTYSMFKGNKDWGQSRWIFLSCCVTFLN